MRAAAVADAFVVRVDEAARVMVAAIVFLCLVQGIHS
jgi:hypothetical protein